MANHRLSESSSTKTLLEKDRALFADPGKKALLSVAEATDLTASIGTTISGVQLQNLTHDQLDELALLVSERGVVFFRGQDLDHEGQTNVFKHYERLDPDATSSDNVIGASNEDQWPLNEWNNARSPVNNSPSYSILRVGDSPKGTPAETIWVSQYGLYDELSGYMRTFLDGLHVSNDHSNAVRTHPATRLKALNVLPGSVSRFDELKKKEADNLLQFLDYHLQAAHDHSVRWKWEAGDVAVWDNRCTAHKAVSSTYTSQLTSELLTCSGEKPYFDSASESREDRTHRLEKEAKEEKENLEAIKARFNNTPLRRIISRQLNGEIAVPDVTNPIVADPPVSEPLKKSASRADSVLSEEDSNKNTPAAQSREERIEQWTKDVHTEAKLVPSKSQKPAPLRKSNTPLRRILERQVSSSLERRLHWR